MRISVIGTGYLGATHAAALASWGHEVVGIDVDPGRVAQLGAAVAPFHEPGFHELLRDGVRDGRLAFSTDLSVVADADLHFLCVGTPQLDSGHGADLGALWQAVEALAPHLRRGALVVGKSTVPVGTAALVQDRLDELVPPGHGVEVAWNPEFLREAHAVEDSLRPDRLVLGVASDAAEATLREVYAPLLRHGTSAVRTDLQTAELAKASANVMLASRISLVNVLAEVCEVADADIERLTQILGLDARIGSRYLSPGIGFGGGCLPKDLRAFATRAAELGVDAATELLGAVDAVNTHQRQRAVDLAVRLLDGHPRGRNVAVLGAAFKADSDDVRDSPALAVATSVAQLGACVRVFDPQAGRHLRDRADLETADSAESACAAAEVTLVLTEWPQFAELDPAALGRVVERRVVVDGRLVLDPARWARAGWQVHAFGRGEMAPRAVARKAG